MKTPNKFNRRAVLAQFAETTMYNQPTVFHITHAKAGSQWVGEVLRQCAPDRYVRSRIHMAQFREDPIKLGGIYGALFESRQRFEAIMCPQVDLDPKTFRHSEHHEPRIVNWFHFQILRRPYIKFVVIRDLRDTLVSLYFSLKVSHPILTGKHAQRREILNTVPKEEGLIYLINKPLRNSANIQVSWTDDDALLIKYEQLLTNEYVVFERIIDYCQINVDPEHLHDIIRRNSFEAVTGRERGQEKVTAHQRKGIAGDWRNHFSDRVKEEFKNCYGQTLIKTGYESDLDW